MARSAPRERRSRLTSPARRSALLPAALALLGAMALLLAAAPARAQAPPTPTGLKLAAGDGQFTATWNASPGAGTYIIQYGVNGARLQLAVYVRPGTATSRTITSTNIVTISNGTTYRARISACSGTAPPRDLGDCSEYSAAATVTPNKQPPGPPGNLEVAPGDGALTLTWTAPGGPAPMYLVMWKESSAGRGLATTAGDPSTGWVQIDISQTRYTIHGLTNGTAYDVQVFAHNGEEHSPWVTASGTPAPPPRSGCRPPRPRWRRAPR